MWRSGVTQFYQKNLPPGFKLNDARGRGAFLLIYLKLTQSQYGPCRGGASARELTSCPLTNQFKSSVRRKTPTLVVHALRSPTTSPSVSPLRRLPRGPTKAANANDELLSSERGGVRQQPREQTMAPEQQRGGGDGRRKAAAKGLPPPRVGVRRAVDEQQAYAEFETLLTDYSEGRAPRPDLPQPARDTGDTKQAIDFTRLRNMQAYTQ